MEYMYWINCCKIIESFFKTELIMRYLLREHCNKPNNLLEYTLFTEAVLYNGHYICPDYCACLKNRQKRETCACFPLYV